MYPDIYKRILNAKGVFERAESMLRKRNELDVSVALLLMHDAVELLMIAMLDHVQAPPNKKRDFLDFWPDMKKAGHNDPPDFIAMDSLNRLRVALKHSGNIPNTQSVIGLFPRTRGFFENVLSLYCGLNYSDISLMDAIPDAEVKDCIKRAREKFAAGKKTDAMIDLAIAVKKIEKPMDAHIPRLNAPERPTISSELRELGLDRYLEQLHSFLAGSATLTNALTFGYDPFEYRAFKGIMPSVLVSMGGTYQSQIWLNYDDMSQEQFDVLVSYLINHAIRLGEAYQPMRPPLPQASESYDVISIAQTLGRIKTRGQKAAPKHDLD